MMSTLVIERLSRQDMAYVYIHNYEEQKQVKAAFGKGEEKKK